MTLAVSPSLVWSKETTSLPDTCANEHCLLEEWICTKADAGNRKEERRGGSTEEATQTERGIREGEGGTGREKDLGDRTQDLY